MRILLTLLAGLLGLAFGSFLNVCLSRWPAGESVVQPRSHCRACGRTLTWWENVPLVSWLALRGRCRRCSATISWRYPLVELAVGGLWALVAWQLAAQIADPHRAPDFLIGPPHFGIVPAFATAAFVFAMVGLAVLDAEHFWIADAVTLPGIALGFTLPLISVSITASPAGLGRAFWISLRERAIAVAVAAGIVLLIRWVYWLIRRREGIGLGDAKLMAMLGAWLGFEGALLSFGLGVLLGAVAGVVLLVKTARAGSLKEGGAMKLPLGTFLCIGGIVSALWGQPLIVAYLHRIGLR
jgi:leader peptidase (prepilin peptidase) / N-methyltransferase